MGSIYRTLNNNYVFDNILYWMSVQNIYNLHVLIYCSNWRKNCFKSGIKKNSLWWKWFNKPLVKFLYLIILIRIIKNIDLTIFIFSLTLYFIFLKKGLINFLLNQDDLVIPLILLITWVFFTGIILLNGSDYMYFNRRKWLLTFFVLILLLFLRFFRSSIIFLYILFERIFLLIFLIIINWGYSPERLQSAIYILFYTLVFSLPFLIILILRRTHLETFFIVNLLRRTFNVWSVIIFLVFLVKIPTIFFHLWLPKAHVEAPIFGSIVLAGVLLKIGGYGISRFLKYDFYIRIIIFPMILLSCILVSFCVLFQRDMKSIIAYSSVAHIVLVVVGIISFRFDGNLGMILLIITHGVTSSTLFIISFLLYSIRGTRRILILENFAIVRIIRFWFFIFMILSLSIPLSSPFFRELMCISSSIVFMLKEITLFILILFLFGVYGILIFFIINMGGRKKLIESFELIKERFIFIFSIWPIYVVLLLINFM